MCVSIIALSWQVLQKQDDLKFFAHTLCDIDYAHMPDLAPTREMFERYKLQKGRLGDIFFGFQ